VFLPVQLRRFRHLERFIAFWVMMTAVRAGEVKVDINRDSKNSAAETEVGYVKWSQDTTGGAATGTNPVTKSFTSTTGEPVTVSFAQTALSASRGGTGLLSNWYQTGAQGTAKLVSDGLTVAPANLGTGGEMVMTIIGLSAGPHTLLTYHNAWDALAAGSLGPMDIFVNGVQVVNDLQPTIRAATNAAAPVAYLEFEVAGPTAVTTILFSADTTAAPSATIRNVMINGFEIDTPNSTRIAQAPLPADGDEHVDADAGSTLLSWSAPTAGNATSYDVYLGTSRTAVKDATRASVEFRGNQADMSYPATGILSALTYFWRVDAVDAAGNATRGTVWYFRPRHLAFPGAEGWGRFARGGRGGSVVEVTSLADYVTGETPVPGSLRYAIEEVSGPRTIVFAVSGMITLRQRLTLSSPYVTIAGHTAPGKGICLRQFALGLSGAKDAIVRFIRNRPGNMSGQTIDGGGLAGCDHAIMDHCSISWSIDEAFSGRSAKNITLQRTLISEALNIAGHQNYPPGTEHGYAATISGDKGSYHHNLLAHCDGRNWSLGGGLDAAGFFAGRLDIRNNVVYNWRNRTTDGGAHEVNFVANYYKPGAASVLFTALNPTYDNFPGTQQYYMAGNVMPGRFDEANQAAGRTATGSNGGSVPTTYSPWVDAPFFADHVTTHTAAQSFKIVLSDVGCTQPMIDDHDARVIRETLNGTYTYTGTGPYGGYPGLPNSQDDVGGWENYFQQSRPANWDSDHDGLPNWWENLHGSNPNSAANDFSDSNADAGGDGFTALEDYLHWIAAPYAATTPGVAVSIDLVPFSGGFTGATYAVFDASGGSVALHANGHTAIFTPANGFNGLAKFDFTVSGGGTSVTRTVGIAVSPQPIFERRWKGGANSTWDTTSENWLNGSTVGAFQPGSVVIFDETGAANPNVALAGVLQPASVFVAGPTNYTFTGSGTFAAGIPLTKSGSGTLTFGGSHSFGSVVVEGGVLAATAGTLTVDGNVTNNGTIRLTGGAALNVGGTFVNNGVLDMMTGAQTLPPNFINHGVVLDASAVRIQSAAKNGTSFTVTIQGYTGHTYQLKRSETLDGVWMPVGPAQSGNDSVLTFTDSESAGDRMFYRVTVAP
jgi:autotransporter-associated beta strand protein